MKEDYIESLTAAGFQHVSILDETLFPVDFTVELMANDPTAQAIIENLHITPEEIKEVASSVVSIKVQAVKSS